MWTNFNDEKKNQRYEPLIVSIDIGDTIIWKSVEKSHNVEFMKGGVPEGVLDAGRSSRAAFRGGNSERARLHQPPDYAGSGLARPG